MPLQPDRAWPGARSGLVQIYSGRLQREKCERVAIGVDAS